MVLGNIASSRPWEGIKGYGLSIKEKHRNRQNQSSALASKR